MTRIRKAKKTGSRGKSRTQKKKRISGMVKLRRATKLNGVPICERLAHLLTETSVVIYAARAGGDYGATFVSDNVRRLTGFSPRSFLHKTTFWFDHVHPEDRARVLKEIPRVFDKGYYEYEYRFRHKNGHYVWVRDEMRCVCDKNGRCVEIVGYWIEITKRKVAEAASETSAERLQKFMDSATEGFLLVDSKFNVIAVNKYLVDKFGFTKEEAMSKNILDVSSLIWESGRYEQYAAVLEDGRPRIFEDVIAPAEYGDMHVHVKAFKVGDDLGMIIRDITEEKKRERTLKESEERLRSLYESTNAGIVFLDAEGIVLLANAAACDMLDIDEEGAVSQKINKIMGEVRDERGMIIEKDEHPVAKTLKTLNPINNAILCLAQKDPFGKRWLLVSTQPIFDAITGKLDEVLVSLVDFTEQKQIEEALFESEERYRHLFENSPIGIGVSTLDGKVITANRSMLDITGYDLNEFRKINIAKTYVNREDREQLLNILSRDGRVTNHHVRLRRKDGTVYDAILSISVINIAGKDCFHTICQPAL